MSELLAGRPSDLTQELTLEIRKLVLSSLSYIEIQEILSINSSTWDRWVWENYKDFRANLQKWKHERMVKKAEVRVDSLMDSDDDRVALNAATFTLETLGKLDYSKMTKTDITSGGRPLQNSLKELTNEELARIIADQSGTGQEGTV